MATMAMKEFGPNEIYLKTSVIRHMYFNFALIVFPIVFFFALSKLYQLIFEFMPVGMASTLLLILLTGAGILELHFFYKTFWTDTIYIRQPDRKVTMRRLLILPLPFRIPWSMFPEIGMFQTRKRECRFEEVNRIVVGIKRQGNPSSFRLDDVPAFVAMDLGSERIVLNQDSMYAEMVEQGTKIARLMQKPLVDLVAQELETT